MKTQESEAVEVIAKALYESREYVTTSGTKPKWEDMVALAEAHKVEVLLIIMERHRKRARFIFEALKVCDSIEDHEICYLDHQKCGIGCPAREESV